MKTRKARTVSRPAIIHVTSGWGVNVYVDGKLSKGTSDDYNQPMNDDGSFPQTHDICGYTEMVELCKEGFAAAFGKQYEKPGVYPVVITIEAQGIA